MTYSLFERLPYEKKGNLGFQRFGHSFHFTCTELRFTYTASNRAVAEQGIRDEIRKHGGSPKFDGVHTVEDANGQRLVAP